MSESNSEQEVRFEALVEELEAIVAQLERGELPLEQALERFERGTQVAQKAGAILDGAQMRVDKLIESRDGQRAVPLDDEP